MEGPLSNVFGQFVASCSFGGESNRQGVGEFGPEMVVGKSGLNYIRRSKSRWRKSHSLSWLLTNRHLLGVATAIYFHYVGQKQSSYQG